MTHTEIQANVTKTAAFTGAGIGVASITGDWTLKLQVSNLTAGAYARFEFDDTTNDFTASLAGPTFSFLGAVDTSYDRVKSVKLKDFPSFTKSIGVSGGQIKLKLSQLDASATCTWHAWLES